MSSDDERSRQSPLFDTTPRTDGSNFIETSIDNVPPEVLGHQPGASAEDGPPRGGVEPTDSRDPDSSSTGYAERINAVTLPAPVDALADDYAAVFGERDRFLWRWIYSLLPHFTLSSVPEKHTESARIQKTILTIYITLMDDLAEKRGDSRTFEEIRRVVSRPDSVRADRPGVDADVVSLAERLWTAFETRLAAAPRYDEYYEVLEYDVRQAQNAMDYSRLVNERLSMANLGGSSHYCPHNMVMFPYADVDLMYSPAFDRTEFGSIRELIWTLQKMARIGNWLSTWERELQEGDYTAGVVVYALRQGIISVEGLESADPERCDEIAQQIKTRGVEARFAAEWCRLYDSVVEHGAEAESIDLDDYVAGMETVMAHHMASRGHK